MSRVLILNAGSSSLKWSILQAESGVVERSGNTSWTGSDPTRHGDEMRSALQGLDGLDAIGHRVVHGGSSYHEAVVVDKTVRAEIARWTDLAPLHNPAALAGIEAASAAFPSLPQVAAFDTAFHATISPEAARYAVPWEWSERWGLRRYGFHGLSVMYAVGRVADLLGTLPPRLVVCHLGAGCSITAVADGRSVDTSMGLTPLEGVMMATRSGSVDPGLLLYLLNKGGLSARDLEKGLDGDSGLRGVSGVSADLRAVLAAADSGNERAALAYRMFIHRLVRVAGAMVAVLGGLDALVFTGGIGEHSARVRGDLATALAYCGLALEAAVNATAQPDCEIAAAASTVRVLVITAREDLAILSEMRRLLPL